MDMDKMKEKLTQIDPLATIHALQSERKHGGERRERSDKLVLFHEDQGNMVLGA
jgi:hypothetical protein